MVRDPPCNAPVRPLVWSGKTPHAEEQLSLRATATKPTGPGAQALRQEEPPPSEAWAPQQVVAPAATTRASRRTATKAQHSQT